MGDYSPPGSHQLSTDVIKYSLDIPSAASLAPLLRERRLPAKGQHVCRQGDPARDIYFLVDGALKAYRVGESGEEGVVRFYFQGELVWSDCGSGIRSMSLVTLEPSRICALSQASLQWLMARYPSMQARCYGLLRNLISEEQALLKILSEGDAEHKLAFLLRQLAPHRSKTMQQPVFSVSMPRSDIANYLGMRIEALCRAFSRLQALGLIEVMDRAIRITDLQKLEFLATGGNRSTAADVQQDRR